MRRSTKRLLSIAGAGGAVFLGLAASGQYAASRQGAEVERALHGLATEVGSVAVDPWRRRMSLARLVLVRPRFRITIDSLDLAAPRFASFALVDQAAAGVATVTAHDIRIEAGDTVLSIPRIEVHGTGSSGVDLARLFDPDSPKPLAERLAKLSVGSLLVPEITLTEAAGPSGAEEQSIALHGLTLDDVVGGRIGSAMLDHADASFGSKEGVARTASLGRVSASGIDLPLAANIAQGSRTDPEAPLRPIYEAFSIASMKFRRSATEGFEIGPIQSAALEGRPLAVPMKEAATLMDRSGKDLSDADRTKQTAVLVDILKSFSLGRLEIRDFSFAKTGDDDPASISLGRLLIDGFDTFRSRSIAVEHFALAGKDARITFSRSALEGVDGSGLVDVMGSTLSPADISPEQVRRLAPKLASASMLDFRVEVPVADLTGNADAGRTTLFTVPVAEIRAGHFVGNLASDVSSHIEAIYDVASPAPGSALEAMAKAGFGRLDMTSDYAANWSDSMHEFKLDQLSFAAKDLASLTLGGTLSNMSTDLMSPDKALAKRAAQDLQVRSLSIALVNSGLAEKGLPLAAASMNVSVAELKSSLNSQVADLIAQIFGPSATADQLTGAIARFIDQPKTLDVSVKAPEGLSVKAIGDAASPQELLNKLEISAVADR